MPLAPFGFAPRLRMTMEFAGIDLAIPTLFPLVESIAVDLRDGQSLEQAVRRAAQADPEAAAAFDIAPDGDLPKHGFALNTCWSFPSDVLPQQLRLTCDGREFVLALDAMMAPDLGELLSVCGSESFGVDAIRDRLDEPLYGFFESMLEHGLLVPAQASTQRPKAGPGITRLQHAGLLVQGHRARVLVDPHCNSNYEGELPSDALTRAVIAESVDAVLITHSHSDHFHLPTLLTLPAQTAIIVPRVAVPSMLCPDMAATLRAFGRRHVVELDWNAEPYRFEDVEVIALPFFGEQPLRDEPPRHVALRNHGNTYLIRHANSSCWLLADSGADWMGSMTTLAVDVRSRFGAVDRVISNLGEFTPRAPGYITGGHYWLSLSASQMARFTEMRNDLLTLGPKGVASICELVGAKQFLPYAHWWCGVGEVPSVEPERLSQLQALLTARGCGTVVVPWRVGDTVDDEG